jgi:hypothetical protein
MMLLSYIVALFVANFLVQYFTLEYLVFELHLPDYTFVNRRMKT